MFTLQGDLVLHKYGIIAGRYGIIKVGEKSDYAEDATREGYPIMLIDIIGYVTELHGENGFKIKVTSDRVYSRSFTDIQVSKEVRIWINAYRYPSDDSSEFKLTTVEDKDHRDKINKCRSLSKALRMGDQVQCAVYIVEKEIRDGVETYVINNRGKDIETYPDSDLLWLCPYDNCFVRLEVDSRESLKFRKQWFHTCRNREKCEKITGSEWNGYRNKWWINKNPKIISPIIWWIQVKTKVSNLLKRPTNSTKIGIVLGVIGIVTTIIFSIISIIF